MHTYSLYTDSELIDLLKFGDHNAFAEIYSRYKGPLYIHAFNLLRNREASLLKV